MRHKYITKDFRYKKAPPNQKQQQAGKFFKNLPNNNSVKAFKQQ